MTITNIKVTVRKKTQRARRVRIYSPDSHFISAFRGSLMRAALVRLPVTHSMCLQNVAHASKSTSLLDDLNLFLSCSI